MDDIKTTGIRSVTGIIACGDDKIPELSHFCNICNSLPELAKEIKNCEEQLQTNFSLERFMELRYFSKVKALRLMLKFWVDYFETCSSMLLWALFDIESCMEVLRANRLSDFASQLKNLEVPKNYEVLCTRTADDSQLYNIIIGTIGDYLTEAEGDTFEIYRQSAEKHYEFIPHIIEQIQNFLDEVRDDSDGLFSNWRKIDFQKWFMFLYTSFMCINCYDFEKEEKARVIRCSKKLANTLTAEDWNETYLKIKEIEEKAVSGVSVAEDSSGVLSEEELRRIDYLAQHNDLLKRLHKFNFDDELFDFAYAVYFYVDNICRYIDNGDIARHIYDWIARSNIRKMNMYPELKAQYPEYLRKLEHMAGFEDEEKEEDAMNGDVRVENCSIIQTVVKDNESVDTKLPSQSHESTEANDKLVMDIKGCFYGDEEEARAFIERAKDMKDKDITAMVTKWVADNKISGMSHHRDLWKPLHDAGIYRATETNWNRSVPKKQ